MIESLVLTAAVMAGPASAGTVVFSHVTASAAHIPSRWQRWADCVSNRESHGNYKARNRASSAAGRWQFLRAWQRGLSFMVRDRLIAHGMDRAHAKSIQRRLAKTPIHLWEPWAQDAGFAAVIAHPQGWRHWSNGGRCDRLAAAR